MTDNEMRKIAVDTTDRLHKKCSPASIQKEDSKKRILDRFVAMLAKSGQRGYSVRKPTSDCGRMGDCDPDSNADSE